MGDDPRISILLASKYVVMFHLWTYQIPDSVKNSGLPTSIMLWDTSASNVQGFVQYAQPGYATHAYGMNEYVYLVSSLFRPLNPFISQGQ